MAYKITIPETTEDFKEWLHDYILNESEKFWAILNFISGVGQTVDASLCLNGLGTKDFETIRSEYQEEGHLALVDEIKSFLDAGYSVGDFQHIVLNTYTTIAFSFAMNGKPLEN